MFPKLNEKNIGKFNLFITSFVLILFAIIIIAISIISKQHDFEIFKNEVKNKFIQEKKKEIKFKVDNTNRLIIENAKQTVKFVKKAIKLRVENSYNIAYKIYNDNKNSKSKNEIIDMIREVLRPIRFDKGSGYIFMVDMQGKELLFPVSPYLEGINIYNLQDKKGNYVIQKEIAIVKEKNEGLIEDFWTKPNVTNKDMIYPKLTYVKGIKELNIYIGSGMYIDDANAKSKKYIKNLLTQLNKQNIQEYIIVSELLNIDGGDKFAKIIVHPTAPLGKLISDDKKDIYGKYYRKEYLKALKEKGETYLKYSYINPKTNKETSKISYFVLNKQWNWIIGTGFHDNLLDMEINTWQNNLDTLIKKNIYTYISLLILFSLILFVIVFMLNKFTYNIISNYKNRVELKQEELNQININLEHRIEEEVEKSKHQEKVMQEQSKMVAMGEMIGNIAHQWRQPLSTISTAATGMKLKKEYGLSDTKDDMKMLDAINNSAQHLSQTIDDFRNFIKGDKAKNDFMINETLNQTLTLEEGILKSNNITVIKEFDKDVKIHNLQHGLLQSCLNIINNSKDALQDIAENDRYIFISTKIILDKIEIYIKDTAGGIPQNIISKVFEPYFTTKHKSQGTGLGLHMTYNIITQNMNGTIFVKNVDIQYQNKKYKGALFTIVLPINLKN